MQFFDAAGPQFTDEIIDTLARLPDLSGLQVNELDRAVLGRLQKLNGKLRDLNINHNVVADSEFKEAAAVLPVTRIDSLEQLTIAQFIALDNTTLQAVAKLPRLKSFVIYSNGIPENERAAFRNYTADDIAAFRKARPDVALNIDGQDYPSTKAAGVPAAPAIDFAAERKGAKYEWHCRGII